jgi:hypothetical protein
VWLGIGLLLILHHFWGYYGHYGFDDVLGYGYYAHEWAQGQLFFLSEDFFSYRWGFIAPTSIFYALFGVNDHASAIFPTFVYIATAALVARIMRLEKYGVAALAMLIYGLDSWTMYYSDKLMADTSVALAVLLAFSAIARERFEASKSWQNALLLSASVFWGYLSKQSILLLFPVFLILLIIDITRGRYREFWVHTIINCTIIGVAYLVWIYMLTGNPFERFAAVNQGVVDNLGAGRSFSFCNYSIQASSVLYYRLFAEMGLKFIDSGMALSFLLAMPTLISQRWSNLWQTQSFTAYWSFVFILALLSANFMTTSYEAYLPICPDIRHFLMLVPLAAVVAAPSVANFATTKEKGGYFIASFALGSLLGLAFTAGNMRWLYVGILLLIVVRMLLPNNKYSQGSFLILLIGILFLPVLSSMRTAVKDSSYLEQRALIEEHFQNKKESSMVITDQIGCNIGRYWMAYDPKAPTQFYTYQELSTLSFPEHTSVYLIGNGDMLYRSGTSYERLPRMLRDCYERSCPPQTTPVYRSDKILLLQVHEPQLLLKE